MKERVRGIFTKEWLEVHGNDVFAYSGLVLCILVFSILPPILRGINILDPAGLAFKSIVKDGVMYSILAAGAVFVYSLGAMDISVGAQISMYAILLIHTYNVGGSSIGALVGCVALIFVIAMVCGITNSVIANVLEMKPIITSLILQFLIYGIASVVINIWNPASIAITFDIGTVAMTHFAPLGNVWVQVGIMVGCLLLFTVLFNYTKIGHYVKAIGANQDCARQMGISLVKYRMLAYMIFGVAIVVASLLFVANTGTTTSNGGKGYEMKIMISLIIGGMPLSGGMKSKISSAVIGGFTYALITRSFIYIGVPDKYTTVFVALIYIVVVLLTCRSKDKVLPR